MQGPLDADVQVLLSHQHVDGAYVASPSFSQYPYGWLRDGAFIAHALDRVGRRDSSGAFHTWVASAVLRLEPRVRDLIARRATGAAVDHDLMLPARFTLDGRPDDAGDWPDFQLDGYGQWLWSLGEHVQRGGAMTNAVSSAARLVADYLVAFWDEPCYDAWEEGRTQHHTSTLASACAGLRAAARLLDPVYGAAADGVWRFIEARCVEGGAFVKCARNPAVDASAIWLATPFGLVEDDDPRFVRTLERVEHELVVDGGVLRYRADTFYGGGAWALLTAGLAWHHARYDRVDAARALLATVDGWRAADGGLPEQVPVSTTDPWFLAYWTHRWGPSAAPLLWSHAMVVAARVEIDERAARIAL